MNRTLMTRAGQAARTVWAATRIFIDDQGLSWAGAIGLYLFLSVPPFVVAATYLGGLVAAPATAESFVLEQVAKYLPAEQRLLEGIVAERPDSAVGGLLSTALLLFSGSRAFAALTSAVNVMWRRVDALTFVRRQVLRLGMLGVTVALLCLAALAEAGIAAIGDAASADDIWLLDWQLLPGVLLASFLLVAYKLLPREPVSWRHAALGAVVATVGIRLAQAATGWLAERGLLQTPYGDLAGVALMATWALITGTVILFGAALVAALDGKRPLAREADERFSRARHH
jgi:YihY family inner membrane protein